MATFRKKISRVEAVSHAGFREFVAKEAIVLMRSGSWITFSPGVERFFSAEYADALRLGCFDRAGVPAEWILKYLGTDLADTRRSHLAATDTYYLFLDGLAIASHPAQLHNPAAEKVSFIASLTALAVESDALSRFSANLIDEPLSRAVIRCFEDKLTTSAAPKMMPPPASAIARRRTAAEVLGVGLDATNEELEAARRAKLKANHPDYVEHMSDEIKAVAKVETLAINLAYEELKKNRTVR